jgi:hypothetical protein
MTTGNKRAIVSFANENGNYIKAQQRLRDSLNGKTDADLLMFVGENSINAPLHSKIPYAFKIYSILRAYEMGYTSILYLDTSAYAIADVNPIFEIIERDGYFMEEAGHYCGTWTNDKTLNYFDITRDQAMNMTMYSAGFTGLDFKCLDAREFFDRWVDSMHYFKGQWNNLAETESKDKRCQGHRHDMSCASIIANQLGMKYQSGGSYFQYAAPDDIKNKESVIFYVQGM